MLVPLFCYIQVSLYGIVLHSKNDIYCPLNYFISTHSKLQMSRMSLCYYASSIFQCSIFLLKSNNIDTFKRKREKNKEVSQVKTMFLNLFLVLFSLARIKKKYFIAPILGHVSQNIFVNKLNAIIGGTFSTTWVRNP
jgi:hypothetical protein